MDVQIREAAESDADAITAIVRDYFAHLRSETCEKTRENLLQELTRCGADDSHAVYVAENTSGEVVGYVAVHWLPYLCHPGPEGFVSELVVAERSRGQGIGTRLLDTVVQEARSRGCYRLQLINIRGRESYERGFYRKRGWEERPEAAPFMYRLG